MDDVCTYFDRIDNLRSLWAIRFANGQMLFCYATPVRIFVEKIRVCAAGDCFESRVHGSAVWQAGCWREIFWVHVPEERFVQARIEYRLYGDRMVRGELCRLEA